VIGGVGVFMSVSVYQYTDYRTFFHDWFKEAKKELPKMSYRYLSQRTGIDSAYISRTLHKQKHLTPENFQKFLVLLQLNKKETTYLEALFDYTRVKNHEKKEEAFQYLLSIRDAKVKVLPPPQYRYWMFWYIPAVRLTLLNYDFKGDFAGLARRITPKINEKQAREAIKTLEELNLICQNKNGVYEVLDLHLSTGDQWVSNAIIEFQSKTLELAQLSLRQKPSTLREISTLTFAIPQAQIPVLQKKMRNFRSELAKWAVSLGDSDCVMQFNLASFPLSLPEKEDED